ncbi:unnamed protein product [Rhizoctonia solani]|uniref:Uncharacterized protein n=1 Tax=Rhizoctonia solani TaxID=456999 RepID=A0A8H3E027_9AGAM|nr:unnamed protein product [Rhizoctonia solani]
MASLLALSARQSPSSDLSRNISNYAHQMAASITSSCTTNEPCRMLTASIIPTCEQLNGAAGCWCGNREAFYRCSLCVAGSTGNQTSQETTYPFQAFEESCGVYEQLMQSSTAASIIGLPIPTASAGTTMGGSSTQGNASGGSIERGKLPIGVIVGGVLGAIIGLLIVFFGVRLLARLIKKDGSKQASRNNYYYKSVQYSDERSMNVHRSRAAYDAPYECIAPRPISGGTQPDSTHVITSVDSPEPGSPPPYQSSTRPPHTGRYPPDRKSRVV